MSEAEPRRSVRATKGQHKALDQLDQAPEPKKRQNKRSAKKKESEEPEEVIRCICGATEQSSDELEPWIACDKCGVWQHNVCMGMSVFTEDLPKNYYCEQCAPQDHKKLLDAMAHGEKPWEDLRRVYEDEKRKPKSRRGRKKGSDARDELLNARSKSPEVYRHHSHHHSNSVDSASGRRESGIKAGATGKRKMRGESPAGDKNANSHKMRKVSQSDHVSHVTPKYVPPADIATSVSGLPDARHGPVKLLMKSLSHILDSVMKRGMIELMPGATIESTSERLGLEIERAVYDTHAGHREYTQQCRTLAFNLKNNEELILRIFKGVLFPNMLAVMNTEEMASSGMQREHAQMKARADKHATLVDEPGQRMRKTHRGEELVEDYTYMDVEDGVPTAGGYTTKSPKKEGGSSMVIKKENMSQSPGQPLSDTKGHSQGKGAVDGQQQQQHQRRPSALAAEPEDPQTPQPDDYPADPKMIWKGNLTMSTLANIQVRATFAGGCNLPQTQGLPWMRLFPKRLEVAGRIDQQRAVEYLCGLRYNDVTDIVVAAITPTAERYKQQFETAINYFVSKSRYGVISDKGVSNIRDTYLVPVMPGDKSLPEFMLNFSDNVLPGDRKDPILLVVFVYRDESRPQQQQQQQQQLLLQQQQQQKKDASRGSSAAAGHSSPTPGPRQTATPTSGAGAQQTQTVAMHKGQGQSQSSPPPPPAPPLSPAPTENDRKMKQKEGERLAHEIVGSFLDAPTMKFLLPQAWQMSRREWEVVKEVFTADARTMSDLGHLSRMLEMRRSPNQQRS